MTRWLGSLAVLFVLSASLPLLHAQSLADPAGWQRDLESWRTARARQIAAPDGWLSLAGMAWLKPGFNALGSDAAAPLRLPATAPAHVGLITVSGKTVQLLAPAGGFPAGLTLNGQPAREIALSTADAAPSILRLGSLQMMVLERAGRFVLQVKDAAAPALTAFHGLSWYAPDPKLVVLAHWAPYSPAKIAELPTAPGQSLQMTAPGIAEFELHGATVQLEPVVEDAGAHALLFLVHDATSSSATYGGGRLLRTQIPDHGLDQPGTVVLDFNRLENPSCAYTPFANCPQAQEKNRLSLSLEAGEKRYGR
jgi:uncharacterized protein (DUF1684 family)